MGLFDFIGGIGEAISPSKTKKMYKSDALQGQIDTSTAGMDQYRNEANTGIANYAASNQRAIGDTARLNKQTEGETNQMLGGLRNASFMADRERAREGDLTALQGLLGQMGGGMSKSDKIASSRLGYAGRPSSTYMDKARQSYLGAFGAPIAGQIFGGLNQAAGGAAAERGANIGQQMGLMQYRNQLPANLAGMELNPLMARQQARESEIAQLGGLSNAANSNFAGLQEKKSTLGKITGSIGSSLNSAADTAMAMYSGGLMGGEGGGLMKSFGGALGMSAPRQSPGFGFSGSLGGFNLGYGQQPMYGYPQPPMYYQQPMYQYGPGYGWPAGR